MRGTARGARSAITVDLREFGWDRALIATLRHPTLPWLEGCVPVISLEATPLAEVAELGPRDRLSLVAQFAAHQALLHFAGFSDAELHPAEWAIVRKRGNDCRLVRTAARPAPDEAPALTVIQQFAEAVAAPPLDSLRHSWGRAESVYIEAESRLRGDAAADLQWMRRCALGAITSPGPDDLREILRSGAGRFRTTACMDSIRAAASLGSEQIIDIGRGASPLQRYSALKALTVIAGAIDRCGESEIVEKIVDAASRQQLVFTVTNRDSFDASSVRVLEMLAANDAGIWIINCSDESDLPPSRHFVVAPFLAARREVEDRLATLSVSEGGAWLTQFAASEAFPRFLDTGTLPEGGRASSLGSLREPARSYIAALALLGTRVRLDVASAFFRQLMFGDVADELAVDGITTIDDGHLVFSSEATRAAAKNLIPSSSRPTLCRVAADVIVETSGDLPGAAALLIDAGDPRAAAALLEQVSFAGNDSALLLLQSMPRQALTPVLAETLASSLIDRGRYRDARDIVLLLSGDVRELLLARIERRIGDYSPALARLERMAPSFDRDILRLEIFYLENRYDDMRAALPVCAAARSEEERARVAYLRALLADRTGAQRDPGVDAELPADHYLASRLETHRAVARHEFDDASEHAARSFARARNVGERLDAALDRVYVLFTAGAWPEAREEALRTLALVEETQGDRAAGGILFILAYLAADDGQWAHATQRIHRLRHFYRGTGDQRRLLGLDILTAHLDFSRGRFSDAMRAAQPIADSKLTHQIREEACLILDEIDWIEGRNTPLRSTGKSLNVELAKRHETMRIRRAGGRVDFSDAVTRSQKLQRLRDALGYGRNDEAAEIAAEMEIELPVAGGTASSLELRMLREAALREFPFDARDFAPTNWRFATRNRLGQWHEIGSLPPSHAADLDRLLTTIEPDWIVCGSRELLFVEGISGWSAESREALATMFRTRAEHHRMQRVIEQNESVSVAKSEAIDGIIGDSPTMRELGSRITRVARRDVPVCILGESGTGKELAARAIHRYSPRRGKTFTPVNCAALPENLIESELFGCIRGAFTGADRDRAGLIENSEGGTLFLDEIGEMPLAAQAKLLRFLQEGEFRRVGDTVNRTADVRIVSATNRKLESAVEEGRFREDLYYRIGGVEIALPPLRDRVTDVPMLAAHFLAKEHEKSRGGPMKLTADTESIFISYRWPGNVRELQNTIRAAHALAGDADAIDVEHLPERMRNAVVKGGGGISSYQDAVTRFRRDLIEKSLVQANGNQNRAAAALSMSRQALAYQIRELGILVRSHVVTER
ncbi:MAG: two-component system, NtrC family, response regulator AtoC [Thermoanaerobaculia bacterium]|jgi:two-component system response regulator AtoC|nr:two-component system, NtrC family, response regulator AtoC [Thermoanaerobaculia bacterium]